MAICDYTPDEPEGYLQFCKEDFICIEMFYENGWAFGYLESCPQKRGYIPINHVQLLQANPVAQPEITLNDRQKKDVEWMQYVSSLMHDNQTIQHQVGDQPVHPDF
jgi:hypothetical protein